MVKMYLYTGLLSVLLYPFGWYFIAGTYYMHLIYGDMLLNVWFSVGIAVSSMVSLFLARNFVPQGSSVKARYAVIVFGGATLSGIMCVYEIHLLMLLTGGNTHLESLHWWVSMATPGFCATYTAYWIVNKLVHPIASATEASVARQNDQER